jgi:hypothetical protein
MNRTDGCRDLAHRAAARPGEAIISSLPARALLQLVRFDINAELLQSLRERHSGARALAKPELSGPDEHGEPTCCATPAFVCDQVWALSISLSRPVAKQS